MYLNPEGSFLLHHHHIITLWTFPSSKCMLSYICKYDSPACLTMNVERNSYEQEQISEVIHSTLPCWIGNCATEDKP